MTEDSESLLVKVTFKLTIGPSQRVRKTHYWQIGNCQVPRTGAGLEKPFKNGLMAQREYLEFESKGYGCKEFNSDP